MRVFILVSLILGNFFGAGFVSGKEISAYFSVFGRYSIWGIIVSCILIFLLLLLFMMLSDKLKNFSQFINYCFGKFSYVVDILFAMSLMILVGSMFAGSREVGRGLGINGWIVLVITACLVIRVILGNVKSLARANAIMVPIIVIIIIIVESGIPISIGKESNIFWVLGSGSHYAFMNIVTLGVFVLEIAGNYSKRERVCAALISSIIIFVLILIYNNAIIYYDLENCVMPIIELAAMRGRAMNVITCIGIWFGLFTTLITNVYILVNYLNRKLSNIYASLLIVVLMGIFISSLGFSFIVSYIYTIIGIIGIIIVTNLLYKQIMNTTKKSDRIHYEFKKGI